MSSSTYDIIEYLLFKVALFGYSYGFFCVFSGLVFSYATFKTKKIALKILYAMLALLFLIAPTIGRIM
ncbi:hypothetical protein [Xenorhabdus szentirmaii]|uniref:Uncharacterized protein n=1 Tax=Xenorhabdus szentirmaii TaxID=290112 RepID=A0AAW3YWX0_9GAMM|nr:MULTISPECIES: hypothetical protein [unclassified Xenorhabdus]MBD2792722.1 hypothetical protein [Xenorhabdus sp. CUL]MBD2800728.1 hypothetical protein [Xenorhabdus sp. M]MBD2823595.1 hypothetical protein [Xenorhabdus sp. 5]